jgi:hypothetical protein
MNQVALNLVALVSSEVKRPGSETAHFTPSNTEVKKL